jgi:Short C-terminal domain/Phospholipase_D-nuclease N-terminal
VLAYDYPILGFFWTMLIIGLWIAWFMLLFRVIFDIFRSHDMGGFAKALWAIFVVLAPFLGVFVYLIARGRAMSERDMQDAVAHEAAFKTYVQQAAASAPTTGGGTADELSKLAELKAQGVLTDAEFQTQKARILAS